MEDEGGGQHDGDSYKKSHPPLLDWKRTQRQNGHFCLSGAVVLFLPRTLLSLVLSLSFCLILSLSFSCVEKMRLPCGMCESGGGGMEREDEEEGRISWSHSPRVNHRK